MAVDITNQASLGRIADTTGNPPSASLPQQSSEDVPPMLSRLMGRSPASNDRGAAMADSFFSMVDSPSPQVAGRTQVNIGGGKGNITTKQKVKGSDGKYRFKNLSAEVDVGEFDLGRHLADIQGSVYDTIGTKSLMIGDLLRNKAQLLDNTKAQIDLRPFALLADSLTGGNLAQKLPKMGDVDKQIEKIENIEDQINSVQLSIRDDELKLLKENLKARFDNEKLEFDKTTKALASALQAESLGLKLDKTKGTGAKLAKMSDREKQKFTELSDALKETEVLEQAITEYMRKGGGKQDKTGLVASMSNIADRIGFKLAQGFGSELNEEKARLNRLFGAYSQKWAKGLEGGKMTDKDREFYLGIAPDPKNLSPKNVLSSLADNKVRIKSYMKQMLDVIEANEGKPTNLRQFIPSDKPTRQVAPGSLPPPEQFKKLPKFQKLQVLMNAKMMNKR